MRRATMDDHTEIAERLLVKPFREERVPSAERIRMIQQEVSNPPAGSRRRLVWTVAGAVMACIIMIMALAAAYEMPGGPADQRLSRAAGLEQTLRIPIGRTPEEAVQKFRHFPFMRVIHQEPVDGGVLLFIKRYYQKSGTDLQVEYVRKMWLGWKWAYGGGYGTSGGLDKAALTWMGLPYKGIGEPFPLVFGEILDTSVKKVIVITSGQTPGKYAAKVADTDTGGAIWFATLPLSAEASYEIEALNGKGEIVARKTIDDLRDFGIQEGL
ncbi:hypothetical protein KZ483_02065 [Paenibacillus sp. sptzw28]|uniref:hypothetical protein n=1 Tax=Paenibacillus sp. sptzw28 TaxID=715179 RepID=UPI001C6E80F0|nr:hypothetical protein [Paenibacillus sp. sptzw28]QYR21851.1 hypothetical protein KZ483_02065 [Paenibacillus sp. sptzw28]